MKRSLAANKHDHGLRRRAKSRLKREPVRLTGVQARAVGTGIGTFAADHGLVLRAMAVMPDHVHLVVDVVPGMTGRSVIVRLKSAATRAMNDTGIHLYRVDSSGRMPTPWARGGWDRFLHTESEVAGAVRYVESNPERSGMPRQAWRCVTESAVTRRV
ncbi:MAG: transposase [Planctomycetota bacterium]